MTEQNLTVLRIQLKKSSFQPVLRSTLFQDFFIFSSWWTKNAFLKERSYSDKVVAFHSVSVGLSSQNTGALNEVTSEYLSYLILDKTKK